MSDILWGAIATIFFGACVYINAVNKHVKSSKKWLRILSWVMFIGSLVMLISSIFGQLLA